MTLIQLSACGAVMIIAIVAIRALSLQRLPKIAFVTLWTVAAARLMLPIAMPSRLSIHGLLERLIPEGLSGFQIWRDASETAYQASEGAVLAGADASICHPAVMIWAAGVLLCAGFFMLSHIRARRVYGCALPVKDGPEIFFIRSQTIRRPVSVRRSEHISAPLTYGVFQPVILLPKSEPADQENLSWILTHELIHIRRFDVIKKLVLLAVLCIHWFNPLVWVMYVLACRDIELSCDEAVLRDMKGARATYARALLDMEEKRLRMFSEPLVSGFSRNATKERIISIMKWKRPNASSAISAAILVIMTTVVFATTSVEIPSYAASSETAFAAAWTVDMKQDIAPYRAAGFDVSLNSLGYITYNGKLVWVLYDEGRYTYCGPDEGSVSLQVVRGADGSIESIAEITDQQVAELTNLHKSSFGGLLYALRDSIMKDKG